MIYHQTRNGRLYCGDAVQVLRTLPAESIQCCVTSPPYFGLRDYGVDGQIGLEDTPEQFVARLVEVFREVRRVLRPHGVAWVNIGDSYSACGSGSAGKALAYNGESHKQRKARRPPSGTKPGDLLGVPWLLAFALRADGWYLRNDAIWAKRSPMPESVNGWRWEKCRVKVAKSQRTTYARHAASQNGVNRPHSERDGAAFKDQSDNYQPCPGCPKCAPNNGYVLRRGSWRHTRAHEYLFILAKSERYYCDAEAVAEAAIGGTPGNKTHKQATAYENGAGEHRRAAGLCSIAAAETRNPRSVIWLSNEPNKSEHYAAFPTELVRPLLLASTSEKGHCRACGMPVVRVVERERIATRPGSDNKRNGKDGLEVGNADAERHVSRTKTLGWRPSCGCGEETEPATVLDPFSGTATVGDVALLLGLRYVGIDLSEKYCNIAAKRLSRRGLLG